ncbi:MAG: hypothetical protein AABY07_10860 [Nanoarchaeota archaeon]
MALDLTKFYTREDSDILTCPLEGSDKWWVKVKALNARDKKQREQIALRERRFVPKNAAAIEEYKKQNIEETALEYQVAAVRDFEYDRCIEDFCLPYVPSGTKNPIDFVKLQHSAGDVKKFLDNMPSALTEFVEECIAKVNREGNFTEKGEAVKNVSEPLSAKV